MDATSDRIEELAGLAESGNAEICERTARLLAWIEREADGAVRAAEEDGFLCLPKGREALMDYGLILETRDAIEELSASVQLSLS
jgi:hypothetical protein